MTDTDITFLARQSERLMTDVGSLRDDVAVLTAMMPRLDGSMTGLVAGNCARRMPRSGA